MSYSIFCQTKNDPLLEPMFFGQPVNVARYDQQKFPVFEQLIEKQLSFFWRPEEIDVSKDRLDFSNLSVHEQHIFLSNLKYQTLLDSIQGRSPNAVLLPLVSIPELETWIETWSFSRPSILVAIPILFVTWSMTQAKYSKISLTILLS